MKRRTLAAIVAVSVGALVVGATQVPWRALTGRSDSPEPVIAQGSPFECGYVLDPGPYNARHLAVTGTAEMISGFSQSRGVNSVDPTWTALIADSGVTAVHGVARSTVGADQAGAESRVPTVVDGRDPADGPQEQHFGNASVTGASFVNVKDGVVVGTIRRAGVGQPSADLPITTVVGLDDHQVGYTLQDPAMAFEPCPGEEPGDLRVDVYFVAGSIATKAKDTEIVAGPEYAWQYVASFRMEAPSDYFPSE